MDGLLMNGADSSRTEWDEERVDASPRGRLSECSRGRRREGKYVVRRMEWMDGGSMCVLMDQCDRARRPSWPLALPLLGHHSPLQW
ncbi:unnamed protein product [Onchocerca flexuosa]|uniref:Uncharacterized protein n=1 Tax=Onchocerca flexuosa TaxID=387005 RepID=A0A183HT48_9BILA|nr:unnamed protein product [Onchocerca flexuosa]